MHEHAPRTALCTVCATPLPAPVHRGMPSPYCSDACRAAAHAHRSEVRYWRRAVAAWEPVGDAKQLTWCRDRLERATALVPAYFLDPAHRWALRS